MVNVYTDGSCIPNPGKGGWAFIAIGDTYEITCSGGEEKSTNNIMELTAVIQALRYLREFENNITIHTDSQYVINCATGKWKRKMNVELWEEFDKLSKNINLAWNWVRGHSGNEYNEKVDKLANFEATKNNTN